MNGTLALFCSFIDVVIYKKIFDEPRIKMCVPHSEFYSLWISIIVFHSQNWT